MLSVSDRFISFPSQADSDRIMSILIAVFLNLIDSLMLHRGIDVMGLGGDGPRLGRVGIRDGDAGG